MQDDRAFFFLSLTLYYRYANFSPRLELERYLKIHQLVLSILGSCARGLTSGFLVTWPGLLMVNALVLVAMLLLAAPATVKADPGDYEVQPGDTLWSIAQRYGSSVEDLANANSISDPSLIYPGQRLFLGGMPFQGTQPSTRPTPAAAQPPGKPSPQFKPVRGIYISFYAIGSQAFREHAFDLLENTTLNAVIIDVKGDRGNIAFPSHTLLAGEIGAQDYLPMKDIDELMAYFKSRNVYTIARLVVFKDNPLARAKPNLAVLNGRTGELWIDNEGLAWTDPFQEEVWGYNIAIAREAAEKGFDEIQFDYIRFPTDGDLEGASFSQPATRETRQAAIQGFLAKAGMALKPLGVKVAVDTFGYTAWREDDMGIGQRLEDLALLVDVISPMLYPSTFADGIPGYTYAVAYPYELVYHTMGRAMERVGETGVEIRPWLQDFPDYAFDRRPFTSEEVRAQKKAATDAGASGWMLWDPRVKYTRDALALP